ncbi:MAG: carboxypeptidase-like regulatory domain-containing protein [Bryobacteraceae bacterium]
MNKITFAIVAFILLCGTAFGQAVSQISGSAKDQTGAVVPGVEVTATQTETGVKRSVQTDAEGNYILTSLPLGPYRLEATKEGFRTYVQTGLVLQVGTAPEVQITMGVGQVSESVQVEANAAQIETRSVSVGSVMETKRILELPLNGRNATDLIALNGAAVVTAQGGGVAMRTGVRVSVAGGADYSVQYNLDGATHLETYSGSGMPMPFPEALQEFKLSTSTQDASSGGHAGATVDGVTKSGTNNLHGSLFYFVRNYKLNGRDYFALTADGLKRNQFGGTLGGALKKDKLFYFMGYQGTLTRQSPSPGQVNVPTAAMATGDFSAYVNARCATLGAGVLDANNRLLLPLSPAAVKIAGLLPKTSNPCGITQDGSQPISQNDMQVPIRVDYQLNEKQMLFARYLVSRQDKKPPFEVEPSNILNTNGIGFDDMAQNFAIGDTYVISPTLVSSTRLFISRMGSLHAYSPNIDPAVAGLKNFYTELPGLMTFGVNGAGGGFNFGTPTNTGTTNTGYTNFGANQDFNLVKGAHQISFGGNFFRAVLVGNNFAWSEGFFNFNGSRGTGAGLVDFLTGSPASLRQANPNPNWTRQNFVGAYLADVWKVNQKLTLNLGVRWNPFLPMQFTQSDTTNFSEARFLAGQTSTVIKNAIPGFLYPGDPGFNGRSGLQSRWGQFAPRIGLAYDPFGDGKTVIRAGVGLAYDFVHQGVHMNTSTVNPFRTTVQFTPGVGTFDNPYSTFAGGNPFPYLFNKANPQFAYTPGFQVFYLMPPDMKTPQAYQWNLGIQRQVNQSLFVSGTYIGSHLVHLWTAIELNPALYGPGASAANLDSRRRLQAQYPNIAKGVLGSMVQNDSSGTQSYNGLLLNATYRKGNINVSGNYTWSHCIGLPWTSVAVGGATMQHGPYQNNGPVDRKMDMGDCIIGALDMRHNANITSVIATGSGMGGGIAKALTKDWSISTIYQFRTGYAITPTITNDAALSGMISPGGGYQIPQRPNQILADTSIPAGTTATCAAGARCVPGYFNKAAFAIPAAGTLGNIGMGILRAPNFWEWDQALVREFRPREGQTLQFRAEAFNLTNSTRFYVAPNVGGSGGDPTTAFQNPAFGTLNRAASTTGSSALSGSGGRVVQFALKYVF